MKMKKLIYKSLLLTFVSSLLLSSCREEELSDISVVEENKLHRDNTELDKWIKDSISIPYGINIQYRWDENNTPDNAYVYPADKDKVKEVLQAIKYLLLDTYNHKQAGGKDFMKGKSPIKIYLFGGKNKDDNGVERINNPNATASEMFIYNVNNFDKNNDTEVYILARYLHHQFARKLGEIFPYDRDAFLKISQSRYHNHSTELLKNIVGINDNRRRFFGIEEYANKRSFFTMHSFLSPEDDFSEIISASFTNTFSELERARKAAAEPDYDDDPVVQERYNAEAVQAHKELVEKKNFVEEYFNKEVKINFRRMQIFSVQRLKNYIKK